MWTKFLDMHSGGGMKEAPYESIYIEAPPEEAKVIFYNRFGHNPERVTCACCGDDYSIGTEESFEQLTAYHRNCNWVTVKTEKGGGHYIEEAGVGHNGNPKEYMTIEEYSSRLDVLVIRSSEIKDSERVGKVPIQGYVWTD